MQREQIREVRQEGYYHFTIGPYHEPVARVESGETVAIYTDDAFGGTIGTSPAIEAISTLSPGDHGGNMDVPDTCVGNTVYLPVRVEGGLFFTGDCHVAQGGGSSMVSPWRSPRGLPSRS